MRKIKSTEKPNKPAQSPSAVAPTQKPTVRSYPISATQRAMIQKIDEAANRQKLALYQMFLAAHDVTSGNVLGLDEVGIVVEIPSLPVGGGDG